MKNVLEQSLYQFLQKYFYTLKSHSCLFLHSRENTVSIFVLYKIISLKNKYQYLLYALNSNGDLVFINDVEKGLKCNCFCPSCNDRLIARKGEKRTFHFAHHNEECSYSSETILHSLAKKLIQDRGEILFPSLFLNSTREGKGPSINLIREEMVRPEKVYLEKKTRDIVPDVVIEFENQIILIEIVVTHQINDEKYEKIKNLGISTIQIDFSQLDRNPTKSEFESYLFSNSSKSKWVFHPFIQKILMEIDDLYEFKWVDSNGRIKNCPRNNNEMGSIDLCRSCPYLFNIPSKKPKVSPSIACLGNHDRQIREIISRYIKT